MKNARVWDATAFSSSWRTRGSTFFFMIRHNHVQYHACLGVHIHFEKLESDIIAALAAAAAAAAAAATTTATTAARTVAAANACTRNASGEATGGTVLHTSGTLRALLPQTGSIAPRFYVGP